MSAIFSVFSSFSHIMSGSYIRLLYAPPQPMYHFPQSTKATARYPVRGCAPRRTGYNYPRRVVRVLVMFAYVKGKEALYKRLAMILASTPIPTITHSLAVKLKADANVSLTFLRASTITSFLTANFLAFSNCLLNSSKKY